MTVRFRRKWMVLKRLGRIFKEYLVKSDKNTLNFFNFEIIVIIIEGSKQSNHF